MNDRTKDYVFLSYSHDDNIESLISFFDKNNYNVVYDEAMSYGEEWDLNARRYISSNKCKGAIFLISKNSATSKSVLVELEYAIKYKKRYFAIMADNISIIELRNSIVNKLNENETYILDCVIENLDSEKIYVNYSDINIHGIKKVFDNWGLYPDDNAQPIIKEGKYTSDIKGEKERLLQQQKGYYDFDMTAINQVLSEFDREGLCVLDLGCSNGSLTISRFANDNRIKKVIGIDYNPKDIEEAKKLSKDYGDKFVFYQADLENENIISIITDILHKNGISNVDIVFSALVLHHLKNPKLLLLRLYDIFSEDGKIILRGSDDGGKLCYPHSELLKEILERFEKIVKNTDRSNGRKLYGQLYETGYVNVRMLYSVADTCEKDRKDKQFFYKVGFAFRLNRLDEMIANNPNNKFLISEREWFASALAKLEQSFYERGFWYCNTSYIAIASVK